MSDQLTITAKNREDHLPAALRQLDEFLSGQPLSSQQCYAIRLAFEELASNVIHHQKPCTFSADIVLSPQPSMIFKDTGAPFNPLQEPATPDIRLPLEQRIAGKLGIHLVRNMTPSITYERCNGENIIRMQFGNGE